MRPRTRRSVIARNPALGLFLALLFALAGASCSEETTTTPGTTTPDTSGTDEDAVVDKDVAGSDVSADAADVQIGCTTDEACKEFPVSAAKCQKAVCNKTTGKCQIGLADEGAGCDDGKECTSNDKCDKGGICEGATACVALIDGTSTANPCKVGSCGEGGKCEFVNKTGVSCDDGNPCTTDEVCVAGGKCGTGQPKVCKDDGNTCTVEVCDTKTGECSSSLQPDGAACDPKNLCVGEATCQKGECKGTSVTCKLSNNPCAVAFCDPLGGCKEKPIADGQICDDGDSCYEGEKCIGGKCAGTLVKGIDDANPCTKDDFEGKTASCKVVHTPLTAGEACDDGAPCTKADGCKNGVCKGVDLVCNDGNACTQDQCDPTKCDSSKANCGQCTAIALKDGQACEDGNKCTGKDACKLGKCEGIDLLTTGGCDDKNVCTTDLCQPGSGCYNAPVAAGTNCNDSDSCTEVDKCVGSSCKGTPRDCKDNDPCTNDKCDGTVSDYTKACLHEPFDGPCDDGSKCTSGDLCKDGTCAGAEIKCDDKNPCTIDVCDTVKGCTYKLAPGGVTKCDDGLSCTVNDYCDAGKCVAEKDQCESCVSDSFCIQKYGQGDKCTGQMKCVDAAAKGKVCSIDIKTVISCDANNDTPCSVNTCDPNTGACKPAIKTEGLPCTATDKCIGTASCNAQGNCVGATLQCDDKNSCTVDSCDPKVGCLFKPKSDGSACDDGTACTPSEGDKCAQGQCVNPVNTCTCASDGDCAKFEGQDGDLCNEKYKCTADAKGKFCKPVTGTETVCDGSKDTPCVSSICQKATGQCKAIAKAESAPCDDQDMCTLGETCAAGLCKSTKSLVCNDGNSCTDDICDPATGCLSGPKPSGGKCDDGDKCTTGDVCKSGKCTGAQVNCDDGNECTLDLCSKTGGCSNQVDDTLPCSDGDPCTANDACKTGTCKASAVVCDDKNPCTVDACDGLGGCKNIVVDGKDCDDGNPCTVSDVCKIAQCIGVNKACDDGNACTEDACKEGACTYLAGTGKGCDDGNACTSSDVCDKTGACVGKDTPCDNSNTCIQYPNGCLPAKGCVAVTNDGVSCDDGDACTFKTTCKGGACSGVTIDCNDGNVCTNDACDKKKGCQITQNTCDDQNPCTTDTCDQAKGCLHAALDGAMCDDGDECTEKTQCNAGKCEGSPVSCDDKNGCTKDSCDKVEGCVFLPGVDTEVTCNDNNPCTDDSCKAGECVGAKKICDDGNPCTIDECNPLKGCVISDAKEGTSCDDGDSCSANTKCLSGQCAGGTMECPPCQNDKDCVIFDNNDMCDGAYSCKPGAQGLKWCYYSADPVVCDSTGDTPCKKNKCQAATGQCLMQEAINGAKCEDGFGCTANDQCLNGACKSGAPTDCSATANACNDAQCKESGKPGEFSCVAIPKEGTVTCDADGSGCTANDTCDKGKCVAGIPVDCTAVAGECEIGSCKSTGAKSFQCIVAPAKDGDACEDDQLCTDGDFCKTGKCQAGTKPHDCSGSNSVCAVGTCDKTGNGGLGACIPKPQNEGKGCDADGNGCTTNDICASGVCVQGAPPDCQAETSTCGVGACQSTGASTYKCMGVPKKDGLQCEADNDGCTINDTCQAGKCTAGKAPDCSTKNSADGCQIGVCKATSAASYFCDIGFAKEGVTCDSDKNGCTQNDTCNGKGACQSGALVDCFGVTTGCSQGVCKSTGTNTYSCQGDPKADGSTCDADQSGCTKDDKCAAGKCVAGSKIDCTDPKVPPTACLAAACLATGSTTYQCDNAPLKNGTDCNSDSNGCTVNDTCQLGFCAAGDLQTCSSVAGLCADGLCKSTGNNTFKCDLLPKESYPALSPPVACTPTDAPTKCATGYKCIELNAKDNTGRCEPTKQVFCDDGEKCTEGDVCSAGKCTGGAQKDCNDNDTCTLDSCTGGKCVNAAIAGCAACVNEAFDATPVSWLGSSDMPTYIKWAQVETNPQAGTGHMRMKWQGPGPDPTGASLRATLLHRRLYLQEGVPATLQFTVSAVFGAGACDIDDLQVRINNVKVWELCDKVQQADFLPNSNYRRVEISLAKYTGAPLDLEIMGIAGQGSDNSGTIDIDSLKLTGACGPACMGAAFEPASIEEGDIAVDKIAETVPQPWVISSTNAGYTTWLAAAGTGHSGQGYLEAKYVGKPSTNKAETAKLVIPKIQVTTGDKLWLSLRAPDVGDSACGADDFVVLVAGKEVYRRCNALANWQTISVDLPAGQTVEVELQAVSGNTTSTKGTWQIDDLAVSGKCLYGCFYSGFDVGSLGAQWSTLANEPQVWPAWKLATDSFKTPNASLFNQYAAPASPKVNSVNLATTKKRMAIPVMGAVWSYWANVFATKPGICPDQKFFGLFAITDPAALNNFDPTKGLQPGVNALGGHCANTSGWESFIGEVPDSLFGKTANLTIVSVRLKDNPGLKIYVDEVLLMCK
jgi:hypothetical protein